jgi:exopolysaccharide biosynthesis polyprenyl glycosylphosphotransferase
MTLTQRSKIALLVLGDILALYASLFIALFIRYQGSWREEFVNHHLGPFTLIFVAWLIVFYVAGLYDLRKLRNNLEFVKNLALTLSANVAVAIIFFYLIPIFGITPKTNLFIFILIFAVVAFFWRRTFNRVTALSQPLAHLTLIGESEAMQELHTFLHDNPQFGFKIHEWVKEKDLPKTPAEREALKKLVSDSPTEILVVLRDLKRQPELAKLFYQLFSQGLSIHDIPSFYEEVFRKVPITEITEEWFLEQIAGHHKFYDGLKRATEILLSTILLIILSPVLLIAAIFVRLTSPGPIIYRQVRVGKNGALFTLFKFRSMKALAADGSAEVEGATWSAHHDARTTSIGHFLRASHIDEFPQLINILRGEISFVGPRPERPEFVERLRVEVPYYEARLLIEPGVTGWAQLHYHKDQTTADVAEKLKYDIYYLKNRSIILDIAIIVKTIKTLFSTPR